MNKLPMTAAGYSVLERELKRRIRLDRPRLIERIQEAIADDSNLAQNADYQAVKSEQEMNEARIAELEDKLARAEVIDISKLSGDTIKFGATVSLIEEDTGKNKVWQIVGEPEAKAGAMIIGADNHCLEQAPSADPENWQVVHTYLLAEAGVPILEIANLEELAQDEVFEFAFFGACIRLRGATGAPMRPVAMPLRR
jgi:transcription elongation factor GreA